MGEKMTKTISYRLQPLTAQLSQTHYKILLIILLKEFIEIHVNTDTMVKNVKLVQLISKIASAFLNTQTLKII